MKKINLPNQILVSKSKIRRVDWDIRHFPEFLPSGKLSLLMPQSLRIEPLFNSILMSPSESREYEFTSVGVSRVHRHLVAFGNDVDDVFKIAEIEMRGDTVGVHV